MKKNKLINKEHTNITKYLSNNPVRQVLIKNFYNNIIQIIKPLDPKSVLDAGAGEGFALNTLYENKIGEKIRGIDYSKESIRISKSLFPKIQIDFGTIYKLPYKNNQFEIVLCSEVLEHLENPAEALREINRVAKKYLILSVPNEPFFILGNLLTGKNIHQLGNDPEHINHWSFYSFKKFLEHQGLNVVKVKSSFPWTIILCKK